MTSPPNTSNVAGRMQRFLQHIMHHSQRSGGASDLQTAQSGALGARASIGRSSVPGRLGSVGRASISSAAASSNMPRIRIGICAMDKKAKSKPMQEIIKRLMDFGEFEVVWFGDECILDQEVEEWPEAECLLAWYSDGFPLSKAQRYADLRHPFLVNDLTMQHVLQDRRQVYRTLTKNAIPVPTHIIVDRDGLPPGEHPDGWVETEDYVELNGERITKPFVEKPASGEDHNIYIYYPYSMGGGVKRLFRKVDDKSSSYDRDHPGNVRTDGSYIYEEFLATGGTDVKVYTVGPRYAHAEARKSPVVDGRVLRTPDGKEMRFPVLLSPQEKEVARMVTLAFGQKVCGFDLLRSEKGLSYVCDVNGLSFVKNSRKYYDDAAGILRGIILSALAPHRLTIEPAPSLRTDAGGLTLADEDLDMASFLSMAPGMYPDSTLSPQELTSMADLSEMEEARRTDDRSTRDELRCVLAVIRHGDRTPKQKMKMRVTQPELLALFAKHKDAKGKQAKLKSPNQLQELLDITRNQLTKLEGPPPAGVTEEEREAREEAREKFRIVRTVLEQGGQFSGINRKVQLKPLRWSASPASAVDAAAAATTDPSDDADAGAAAAPASAPATGGGGALAAAAAPAPAAPTTGGGGGGPVLEEALMILKYGGVLTHAGRAQAYELGRTFRLVMYPRYGSAGGGLLRLHSTYRHDLKIYSSDEGRVQTSAAAFAKGLLDLEGNSLTPILVSLVQKDASMLDAFGKGASEDIRAAKNTLYEAMTLDPATATSAYTPLLSTTPTVLSPPLSPRAGAGGALLKGVSSGGAASAAAHFGGGGSAPGAAALAAAVGEAAAAPGADAASGGGAGGGGVGGAGAGGGVVVEGWANGEILGLPTNPLQHLHRVVELMKVLVSQLREMCLAERQDAPRAPPYVSLSQNPQEWVLEPEQPCSGERLLLMFDRWQKLLKSFYNEKKGRFDISKVPDIYDSAKYDAIHNAHLRLPCLEELYTESKVCADAVIPNEYGIDPAGKLRIGVKICNDLLGKLIADLMAMKMESLATLPDVVGGSGADGGSDIGGGFEGGSPPTPAVLRKSRRSPGDGGDGDPGGGHSVGDEAEVEEAEEFVAQPEIIHRLCPNYASDINSPLRHVRTRIYFTSESHMHSLLNVLRFGHLATAFLPPSAHAPATTTAGGGGPGGGGFGGVGVGGGGGGGGFGGGASPLLASNLSAGSLNSVASSYQGPAFLGGSDGGARRSGSVGAPAPALPPPLVCEDGADLVRATPELDYLTHIVFRLYESKTAPPESPERFRVEILFSPGVAHDPTELLPLKGREDHTMRPYPRVQLHEGDGCTLSEFERLMAPLASRKYVHCIPSYLQNVSSKATTTNSAAPSRTTTVASSIPIPMSP